MMDYQRLAAHTEYVFSMVRAARKYGTPQQIAEAEARAQALLDWWDEYTGSPTHWAFGLLILGAGLLVIFVLGSAIYWACRSWG